MSRKSGRAAAGLLAAAVFVAYTPVATAEPVWPVTGAESASATADDLEAQGYDVQMARYRRRNRLLIAPQILVNVK